MSTTPSVPDANAVLVEAPEHKQLVAVINDSQLDKTSAEYTLTTFEPLLKRAAEWRKKAATVKVTDISQTREMELARTIRLSLREVRIEAEKTRKRLKDSALRQGKVIDSAYNLIEGIITPIETNLKDQEQFVERMEAERKGKLRIERETLLSPLAVAIGQDLSIYPLADMPQDSFDILLQTMTTQRDAKIAAAAKAESDRVAALKAEADQREATRIESERLKREAAALAAKVAAEKVKADEALAKERQKAAVEAKRLKDEADAKLKRERDLAEATAKKVRDENEAKAKAAAAKADAELAEARKAAQAAATELRDKAFAAEESARKDREAREKLEADAAEARRKTLADEKAASDAAKAAAAAPEKAKILAFAATVKAIPIPKMATVEGRALGVKIADQFLKMATWMEGQAKTL